MGLKSREDSDSAGNSHSDIDSNLGDIQSNQEEDDGLLFNEEDVDVELPADDGDPDLVPLDFDQVVSPLETSFGLPTLRFRGIVAAPTFNFLHPKPGMEDKFEEWLE